MLPAPKPSFIITLLEPWMVAALVDIGQELMSASKYEQPFDADYCTKLALTYLSKPNDRFKVWTAWTAPYGEPVMSGILIGSVAPMLFSPRLMAVEETIYVRPGTPKRSRIADALIEHFVGWAVGVHNAAFVRAGETSGIEPRAVNAFMRRNGFVRSGTLYQREGAK